MLPPTPRASLLERLSAALLRAFSIDLRALAAFRIGVGLILLGDLAVRAQHLVAHYTDAGVLPRASLVELSGRPWHSFHFLSGDAWFQALLFGVAAVSALCLLLGYRTRLATVVAWLLLASLHARNPFVLNAGDRLLVLMLLWGTLLPLGARWSLDARRTAGRALQAYPTGVVVSGATLGLLLQIALLYVLSVFEKTGPAWRADYLAVYYALGLDAFITPLGHLVRTLPLTVLKGLTVATLLLEAVFPVLAFVPAWSGRVRGAAAFAFIGFHLGLGASMYLGFFPFICAVAWLVFLPPAFWDWCTQRRAVAALRARLRLWSGPVTPGTGALLPARAPEMVVSLLAVVLIWASAMESWRQVSSLSMAGPASIIWDKVGPWARAAGVHEDWSMFAPTPATGDGWYAFVGTLVDGRRVSVLPSAPWLPGSAEDKPRFAAHLYPNQRWRKYLFDHARGGRFEAHREPLARYLWERWHKEHPDAPLRSIDIEFYVEVTPLPDEAVAVEPEVLLHYSPERASLDAGVAEL